MHERCPLSTFLLHRFFTKACCDFHFCTSTKNDNASASVIGGSIYRLARDALHSWWCAYIQHCSDSLDCLLLYMIIKVYHTYLLGSSSSSLSLISASAQKSWMKSDMCCLSPGLSASTKALSTKRFKAEATFSGHAMFSSCSDSDQERAAVFWMERISLTLALLVANVA